MNLPNKLTIIRILLVPIFVICFYIPVSYARYIALAVFLIAYFTDWLDGTIARKQNLVTDFGKLMDPMADKLLTAAAMIMLTAHSGLSPIITLITIAREFIISAFRMVSASNGNVIAAGKLGKFKTLFQFIGLSWMLAGNPIFSNWGIPLDLILMWVSVVFGIISCVEYIVKNYKILNLTK